MTLEEEMQAAFNQAVAGLASQQFRKSGVARKDGTFGCKYFGPNGARCAAGWLMEEGVECEEGASISSGMNMKLVATNFPRLSKQKGAYFLRHLQHCHDGARDPANMQANLRCLAAEYSLTLPAVLSGDRS